MQSLSPQPALSWHDRTRTLVRSLPDFLTWTDGLALVDAAHEIYGVWMDKRLYTWARSSGQPLQERIASLPIPHRGRLRQAPRVFYLLRSKREPGAEELRALHQFIDVEEYLCGRRKEIAPDCWSALGDYCTGAASEQHPAPAEPTAPRVRGIVLDVNSPHLSTYGTHPNIGAPLPYTRRRSSRARRHAGAWILLRGEHQQYRCCDDAFGNLGDRRAARHLASLSDQLGIGAIEPWHDQPGQPRVALVDAGSDRRCAGARGDSCGGLPP